MALITIGWTADPAPPLPYHPPVAAAPALPPALRGSPPPVLRGSPPAPAPAVTDPWRRLRATPLLPGPEAPIFIAPRDVPPVIGPPPVDVGPPPAPAPPGMPPLLGPTGPAAAADAVAPAAFPWKMAALVAGGVVGAMLLLDR